MKYNKFKSKVEALGYLVVFKRFGVVKVMNKSGEWLASDFGVVPFNFMVNQIYNDMDLWGTEKKRQDLNKLICQFTSTSIKKRGTYPIKAVA